MLAPNTILQSRYRIVRKLGQGGMGAIYEAIDERVSCVVVVKETLVGPSSQARAAFQREAALLANLRHAALPKVTDYFGEGDGEFLVMEFIPGNDLAELLSLRDAPFAQPQVLRWGIELLKLLEYLHTLNPPVLHRDIKPANLKTTKEGEIYLLDFGLAKGVAGQMGALEPDRSVPGFTPVYASLEQILGQGTDPRSDLYSLAATLYHLLTAQTPPSAPVRFNAVENNQPDPLKMVNQLNVRVSPEVATCIHNALSLSRKERTKSASEMRIALEDAQRVIENRDLARKAENSLRDTVTDDRKDDGKPIVTDDDVQFTVFTPQKIKPEKTYSVLAFAHLSKRRADAADDEPDPVEEVKKQAERLLGEQRGDYGDTKGASSQPVPRGGELSFVPVVKGLTFDPPSRVFTWRKSVHREEFDVRAAREVDGQILKGSMTVFLGSVIIAEVSLSISVDSRAESSKEKIDLEESRSARRVRQVFASYSDQDEQVVAELANVAPLFGSRFIMDRTHLEPGEDRIEGVQRLIRDADVFQLFWSTNSMRSSDTVDEIKYAATLGRSGFILPTYWETPMPRSPAEGLPPPEIERLQFHRIYPGAISEAASGKKKSRLVIFGPTGAEVYLDDQRSASIGSSGRVILSGIQVGKHVLRITRSGFGDDERLVEIRDGAGEQIVHANLTSKSTAELPSLALGMPAERTMQAPNVWSDETPTGELPPQPEIMSAPPSSSSPPAANMSICPSCNMTYSDGTLFCVNCGTGLMKVPTAEPLRETAICAASTPTLAPESMPPAATRSYQDPQVHKRRSMIPIYAGAAAMVLFAMVLVPVFFMMTNRMGSAPANTGSPPLQNPTTPNSNTAANTNSTGNVNSDFEVAPDVKFARLDGGPMRLSDFRGRVVLLNFWGSWNPLSRREVPVLNELHKDFKDRGLTVIGISADDTAEKVTEFQKETAQDYLIGLSDKEVQDQFTPGRVPTTYIIDRRGRIRKKLIGMQSRETFEAAIQPLINERP